MVNLLFLNLILRLFEVKEGTIQIDNQGITENTNTVIGNWVACDYIFIVFKLSAVNSSDENSDKVI